MKILFSLLKKAYSVDLSKSNSVTPERHSGFFVPVFWSDAQSNQDPSARPAAALRLQCFIFAASQSLAGDRPESRETLSRKTYADPRLQRFWQHVGSLLPDPTDPISMQQFREIEANPRPVLELDDAAIDVWLDFYNHTERLQKAEGKYEYMRAFAGRAGELARRVATVFACFEGKTLIDEAAMRGACAVVQYSLDEWLRYAETTQVSVADQQAQRLEAWLISECRKHGVTMLSRVHVMQFCPIVALRKAKPLNAALKPLCDANRVRGEMHGRIKMIAINPDLLT